MTSAHEAWVRREDRRRSTIAALAALLAYLVAFGAAALASAFGVVEVSEFSGPVLVRLGRPDAPEAVAKPVPAAEASLEPPPPETPAVEPAPEPPPVPPAPTETAKPAAKPVPKPAAAPSTAAPAAAKPAPAKPPTQTQRGSENGNTYEVSYAGANPGTVTRGMNQPIWVFMPLPYKLTSSIYDGIPDYPEMPGTADKRRELFRKAYEKTDGGWKLKGGDQPKYADRPILWAMLEDAGYDIRNAEYKTDRSLHEVVILFKVAPFVEGKGCELLYYQLEGIGSGYKDIDDAVLYGFKEAGLTNSEKTPMNGRFTYRF